MLMYQQMQAVKLFTGPENRTYINFHSCANYNFLLWQVCIKLFNLKRHVLYKYPYTSESGYVHNDLVAIYTSLSCFNARSDVLLPYRAQLSVVIRTELLTVSFNMKIKRSSQLNNLFWNISLINLASHPMNCGFHFVLL